MLGSFASWGQGSIALDWAIEACDGTDYGVSSSICIDNNGNSYITGYFSGTADFDPSGANANLTSAGNFDAFLAKYNPNGEYIWAIRIGRTNAPEKGNDLVVDIDGNVYITGNFAFNVDFDPSASVAELVSLGSNDVFIAKYDSNGNYLWAKNFGGKKSDEGKGIALDKSGNFYVTGTYRDTVDIDPSASTYQLISSGSNDVFIAKFNPNGGFVWGQSISGENNEYSSRICVGVNGEISVIGAFLGTSGFNLGGNDSLTSIGSTDAFLAKYDSTGSYLWAINIGG